MKPHVLFQRFVFVLEPTFGWIVETTAVKTFLMKGYVFEQAAHFFKIYEEKTLNLCMNRIKRLDE